MTEEDGDEIFTPFESVRCCIIGFNSTSAIYSKLRPVEHNGTMYMCCPICGGSYGEAPVLSSQSTGDAQ